MKVLILGGDGMLGHQLLLSLQSKFNVKVTLRLDYPDYSRFGIFNHDNSYFNIDVRNFEKIIEILIEFKPDFVINTIAVLPHRSESKNTVLYIEINSLFPQKLAIECQKYKIKLIHISTDGVFSGSTGNYDENSISDSIDLYGRTKYLGEILSNNCITLRTSVIGRGLTTHLCLVDWFLQQKGPISGYRNYVFSGLTTMETAKVIELILFNFPQQSGIYHISGRPINKYRLLKLIAKHFNHQIEIEKDDSFNCNRSLSSQLFQNMFNYSPPSWELMISELKFITQKNKHLYNYV